MPTTHVTRVIFDYDNMSLNEVVQDIFDLAGYWIDFTKNIKVYETSEGNHHGVLETEPIPFQVALNILMASNCSETYKEFVVHRGFTRRVSAKNGKPAPKLVFDVHTAKHYSEDVGPMVIGWMGKRPSP